MKYCSALVLLVLSLFKGAAAIRYNDISNAVFDDDIEDKGSSLPFRRDAPTAASLIEMGMAPFEGSDEWCWSIKGAHVCSVGLCCCDSNSPFDQVTLSCDSTPPATPSPTTAATTATTTATGVTLHSSTLCSGSTPEGNTSWANEHSQGISVTVDTSDCLFATTPIYVTSLGGDDYHWTTTGSSEIWLETATSFKIYIRTSIPYYQANNYNWHISWIARLPGHGAHSVTCASQTPIHGSGWEAETSGVKGVSVYVDTSLCGFTSTPVYATALGGTTLHSTTQGSSEVYNETATGFGIRLTAAPASGMLADCMGWHVNWIAHTSGREEYQDGVSCAQQTSPTSTSWVQHDPHLAGAPSHVPANQGIYTDVDTSLCGFATTPNYATALGGNARHWETRGSTELFNLGNSSFRVYIYLQSGIYVQNATDWEWHINWMAHEDNQA